MTGAQIIIVDVLLEYIDLHSYFSQALPIMHAGIMLDAFYSCSKLCWHHRLIPTKRQYGRVTPRYLAFNL